MSEESEHLFSGPCDFFWGSGNVDQLPESDLPEIAFAGRSNVGKSSLINALTNRKALARISNTPGRTQQLNFFKVRERFVLVDMPGYGYAKVSKTKKAEWDSLIFDYLRGRQMLRCVFLLIDCRHGFKDIDRDLMKLMDAAAAPYRVVLTKADKGEDTSKISTDITAELKTHVAAHPEILVTSSSEKTGIAELREFIIGIV